MANRQSRPAPRLPQLDARELLARLAEQEKFKGHHSPEGRAIRMLSRALSGWSAKALSPGDVVVMCDQAIEDWLRARLGIGAWSSEPFSELLTRATACGLIDQEQSRRLAELRSLRQRLAHGAAPRIAGIGKMLRFCLELVESHW